MCAYAINAGPGMISYRAAKAEGLQPTAPTMAAVDEAKRKADAAGKPVGP